MTTLAHGVVLGLFLAASRVDALKRLTTKTTTTLNTDENLYDGWGLVGRLQFVPHSTTCAGRLLERVKWASVTVGRTPLYRARDMLIRLRLPVGHQGTAKWTDNPIACYPARACCCCWPIESAPFKRKRNVIVPPELCPADNSRKGLLYPLSRFVRRRRSKRADNGFGGTLSLLRPSQ